MTSQFAGLTLSDWAIMTYKDELTLLIEENNWHNTNLTTFNWQKKETEIQQLLLKINSIDNVYFDK